MCSSQSVLKMRLHSHLLHETCHLIVFYFKLVLTQSKEAFLYFMSLHDTQMFECSLTVTMLQGSFKTINCMSQQILSSSIA